jgi:hypothetical protein
MTPHNVKESMQVKELDNCKRELTSSQRFHTFIEVLALTAKESILPASWSSQKVFKGCFLPLQSAAPQHSLGSNKYYLPHENKENC